MEPELSINMHKKEQKSAMRCGGDKSPAAHGKDEQGWLMGRPQWPVEEREGWREEEGLMGWFHRGLR